MRRTAALRAALLLLLQAARAAPRRSTALDKAFRLPDGTDVHYASVPGVPRWRLLPYLWFEKTVTVSCPERKARGRRRP